MLIKVVQVQKIENNILCKSPHLRGPFEELIFMLLDGVKEVEEFAFLVPHPCYMHKNVMVLHSEIAPRLVGNGFHLIQNKSSRIGELSSPEGLGMLVKVFPGARHNWNGW